MAGVTVQLGKGLTVGETSHTEAELREPTASDLLDATADAERVVRTNEGEHQILASPTLVAVHLLRRMVVRIGEHQGPLSLAELRKLSVQDLNTLQAEAEQLQGAALGGALGKPSGVGDATPP